MAIPVQKYVQTNSTVIGVATFTAKSLCLRLITTNPMLPPLNTASDTNYGLLQFTSANDVGNYFGFYSEEYYRALQYLAYNFNNNSPAFIQYSRWVETAVAPMIYPLQDNNSVIGSWTSIDDGAFTLQMGGSTFAITGLDFTGAANLAAVATIIETAIQAETGGGAVWTAATVTYSSTYGGFILTGGATDVVTNPISVSIPVSGTDITGKGFLGWLPQETVVNSLLVTGAIWATGAAAETITETLTNTATISNNFATFSFLYNINLSQSNAVLAATWALTQGGDYIYQLAVSSSNAFSWQAALSDYGYTGITLQSPSTQQTGHLSNTSVTVTGLTSTTSLFVGQPVSGTNIPSGATIASILSDTSITLSASSTGTITTTLTFSALQYPEQIPASIAASINYNGTKTVVDFMYRKQSGITPSVSDESTANAYDAVNINYYGFTQNTGQLVAFYQNGFLQGTINTPADMGIAYNEVWLRSAFIAAFMNLQLASTEVPANAQGIAMLTTVAISVNNQALTNGVISPGKTLTTQQQLDVTTDAGGDTTAWRQVQTSGYWLNVVIEPNEENPDQYDGTLTNIYSKNDVVRKIIVNDFLV